MLRGLDAVCAQLSGLISGCWDTLRKRVCSQISSDDAGADALKVARSFHLSQSSDREVASCDADMVSARSK